MLTPTLTQAPFIGGFIIMNPNMGWRWTEYILALMGFLAFGLNLAFLQETYPPVVLVDKASELRRRTSNWGIHAKQEEIEVDLRELITKNFSRPLRLLFTEPIVLLLSLYMAFIYGLLYLFFTAYPIVFQMIHGMSPGVGGLPFFGQVLGMLLAGVYIALTQPSYNKKLEANNGIPVPEWRLPPVIVGGVTFALGIFWFAWSGYRKDIHWIAPSLSGKEIICRQLARMQERMVDEFIQVFLQVLGYSQYFCNLSTIWSILTLCCKFISCPTEGFQTVVADRSITALLLPLPAILSFGPSLVPSSHSSPCTCSKLSESTGPARC